MSVIDVIVGVDVGGTNTDAVVLERRSDQPKVLAKAKTPTTADVTSGVKRAILLALKQPSENLAVHQVNIGTTHFVNAVVQRKNLTRVSVIRLCGTASRKLPPFSDFPIDLANTIEGRVHLVNGGYQFDGKPITDLDEKEIISCVNDLKSYGESNIVISGIFSPVRPEQEMKVSKVLKEHFPEASFTLSHSIAHIGILERENAAILNECIKPLCTQTIKSFKNAFEELGLQCPLYLTQNDGTVISEDNALLYPVLTFASGPTNSMRGAAFLSGLKEAIVVDIGGTTTDVGALTKGFPRQASSQVRIGGLKTNFRMPDVLSIGLGGGSYVNANTSTVKGMETRKESVQVGPLSAGYRLREEAYVFSKDGNLSGRSLTATDIAVAAGLANIGKAENVKTLSSDLVNQVVSKMKSMVEICSDQMRFSQEKIPVILVGGGCLLIAAKEGLEGASEVVIPENFDVANAVGAALSQISGSVDHVVDLGKDMDVQVESRIAEQGQALSDDVKSKLKEQLRKEIFQEARKLAIEESMKMAVVNAVKSGADDKTVRVIEKDDISLAYLPGNATRIKVKVVGDLNSNKEQGPIPIFQVPDAVFSEDITDEIQKQTTTVAGESLVKAAGESKPSEVQRTEPYIDYVTGEWILSERDIECISIGAGILGCGGGGNPAVGRLLALKALENGMKIRVITPEALLKRSDPKTDTAVVVAFMGAPLIFLEKLVSGNETIGALECLVDLHQVGSYSQDDFSKVGNEIKSSGNVVYIDDYQVDRKRSGLATGGRKIVAILSAEIGGMNCIEPLIVGAELNLPVLDCDGMGRAFPELQMFSPLIYGCLPYPATLADDKGRRAVVLQCDGAKSLEDHFRKVVVEMGCSAGVVISSFSTKEVVEKTVLHSLSHAWRIGDAVWKARESNTSPVDTIIQQEKGKLLIVGKISDILRETTGGFNRGKIHLEGLDDFSSQFLVVEFQNEFLIARKTNSNFDAEGEVVTCVPDLICMVDSDSGQPIPTEEVRYGLRVSVFALTVSPIMATDQALKFVGPQAFGYPEDIKYTSVSEYINYDPVGPK